jgi:hypothetical protein
VHRVHAVELAHELLHLLRDLGPDGASGRREREVDEDVATLDLDLVDQAELHEIEPELGVDDVGERLLDVVHGHG